MNNLDEALNNADWTKRTWDLPDAISYYESRYQGQLREYVERLMHLPVSESMPDSLRLDFEMLFPEILEGKTYEIDIENKVRRVRDVEYWGMPYGTLITPGMKPVGPKSPAAREATVVRPTPARISLSRKPSSPDATGSWLEVSDSQDLFDDIQEGNESIIRKPWPTRPRRRWARQGWEQPLDEITLPDGRPVRFESRGDSPGRGMYNGSYTMYDEQTREYMGHIDYQMLVDEPTLIAMVEVSPEYRRQGVATVLAARLFADSPQGIVAGNTTEDGDAWWQRVKGYVSPDAVIERGLKEIFDGKIETGQVTAKSGDIVDRDEMRERQNRYAIDNGWIVSSDASDNPRRLKAVLAERLWERLQKSVSIEEMVSLVTDQAYFVAGRGDEKESLLRFAVSGSEDDYRAMREDQLFGPILGSPNPGSVNILERDIAAFPEKEFYVFSEGSGLLDIVERKDRGAGNGVMFEWEHLGSAFPVGTAGAEMLVGQHVVGRLIATWAGTSNDDSLLSLAAQEAIREEFDLKKTANWHRMHDYDFYIRHGLTLRKFVRAQHEETQKIFEDINVGGVVIYRGMSVDNDDPVLAERPGFNEIGVEVVSRPASSWSTKYSTAKMFADDNADDGRLEPVIFKTTVTAEEVLSTPLSGFGCWEEEEIVILGGTRDAEMRLSSYAWADSWDRS